MTYLNRLFTKVIQKEVKDKHALSQFTKLIKIILVHQELSFLNKRRSVFTNIFNSDLCWLFDDFTKIFFASSSYYVGVNTYFPNQLSSYLLDEHHILLPIVFNKNIGFSNRLIIFDNKLYKVNFIKSTPNEIFRYQHTSKRFFTDKDEFLNFAKWASMKKKNVQSDNFMYSEVSVFTFQKYTLNNLHKLFSRLLDYNMSDDEISAYISYLQHKLAGNTFYGLSNGLTKGYR